MFKKNLYVHDGEEQYPLSMRVGTSEHLPKVFQFWFAELTRDVLRLGVYFHAVGIFLQVPGAADFEPICDDDYEVEHDIDYPYLIASSSRLMLTHVLAHCFDRLGVRSLTAQVSPEHYAPGTPPMPWMAVLERRAKLENGLLSVVADCLDALIVEPGGKEIEQAHEPRWWQQFQAKAASSRLGE